LIRGFSDELIYPIAHPFSFLLRLYAIRPVRQSPVELFRIWSARGAAECRGTVRNIMETPAVDLNPPFDFPHFRSRPSPFGDFGVCVRMASKGRRFNLL